MTDRSAYRRALLFGVGAAAWLAGTAYYHLLGRSTFEAGAIAYLANALLAAGLYVLLFSAVGRQARVPPDRRGEAALVFMLPGMIGEIPLLAAFDHAMPTLQPETAGLYAAFLFFGYAVTGVFALIWQRNG